MIGKTLEYVDVESPIHRLDPRAKLIWLFCVFINSMVWSSYIILLPLFLHIILMAKVAKVKIRQAFSWLKYVLPIVALLVVVMGMWTPGMNVVLDLGFIQFTSEGIIQGIEMGLRALIVVSLLPLILLTTRADELALSVTLTSISVPNIIRRRITRISIPYSYALAFITALRYVPTVQYEFASIMDAQKVRGNQEAEKGLIGRIKAYIPVFIPLLLSSFERAEEMAIAMETKAFGAPVERTYLKELHLTRNDKAVIIGLVALTVLSVSIRLMMGGTWFDLFLSRGREI